MRGQRLFPRVAPRAGVSVRTSHVGSYPLDHSPDNLRRAFLDTLDAGISVPPLPQLRPFTDMYLDPLAEIGALTRRGAKYELSDADAIYSARPAVPEEYLEIAKLARERGVGLLRAPLTGPLTLSSYLIAGGRECIRDRGLVLGPLLDYVVRTASELSKIGYNFVCVDEPLLSTIVGARKILYGYTKEDLKEMIEEICERANCLCAIHVCGRISRLLSEILLECEGLGVLDHEFKDSPENLEIYSREELESTDKRIALGCVSSRNPSIESVDEVLELVRAGLERFGNRLEFLKPDCGFRGLSGFFRDPEEAYSVSLEKLRVVVAARNAVERYLS